MPFPSASSNKQQCMSNVQNRKRLNPCDTTQESPPAKRIKSPSATWIASNFPPQFWDNLSKVWLTPRALREKDRRDSVRLPATQSLAPITITATTLARFARRGGPDLRHLRGYPQPEHAARMSSNRTTAPSSRRTQSPNGTTTNSTTVFSRAKRSSAYNKEFEQNLIDHGIYPEGFEYTDGRVTPEPENLDDIVNTLSHPRASLSPSQFSISAFKNFKLANSRVISEGKVMADILPIIRGNADILNEGNLPFINLKFITDGVTVDAVPDMYDGSYLKDIDKRVGQDLHKMITPTSHARAPSVPNLFVEAKAPRGGADVAKRQACLDGAIGARAMHSLQNYGEDEQVYDGNARTFSSTYHAGTGTLQLYAHHVTGPRAEEDRPEYHMTQIDSWGMTGNIETFRRGATAFRNSRDLSRRQRETLIEAANARASQVLSAQAGNTEQPHENTALYETTSQDEAAIFQDSDDTLQHITNSSVKDSKDNGEASTTPKNHGTSDEPEKPDQTMAGIGAANASMGFVSSFTTSGTDTARPKRARESFSSPTQGRRLLKSRSRATTSRRPVDSPPATAPPSAPPESHVCDG